MADRKGKLWVEKDQKQATTPHAADCFVRGAGRPLLVGVRPLQLWPLLLCKALLKVMAVYRVLDLGLPHQVGEAARALVAERGGPGGLCVQRRRCSRLLRVQYCPSGQLVQLGVEEPEG